MPTSRALARAHYRHQQGIAKRVARALAALWARVDLGDLDGSWALLAPRAAGEVALGQYQAAAGAADYVAAVMLAQELTAAATRPDPRAFSGTAADGRSLASLLQGAVIDTKVAIGAGMSGADALLRGQGSLLLYGLNETQQAGRNADHVGITGQAQLGGYIRTLTPPSCSRCVVLAGKFYRWNQGFDRHPHCFPAGTVVSGPTTEAATRRWYQGELVVLATASGQNLSLTGNHPVLTRRGWVPANLLREGDDVVRSTLAKGATALVVPDHDEVPALIEDVWRSFAVRGLDRVPASAEDFHGDGQDGEVDVVYADRSLVDYIEPALSQPSAKVGLTAGISATNVLQFERAPSLGDLWSAAHPGTPIGSSDLLTAFGGSHAFVTDQTGFAHAASFDSSLAQDASDRATGDAVLLAQSVLARTAEVGGDDGFVGQVATTKWDAPSGPLTVESASGYASRGADLLERLTGQVELDRVVDVRRVEWSGHVYSLTSSEGWHSANSLIVSNCDCVHRPAGKPADVRDEVISPRAYFDSLSETDQAATFGVDNARAIRDGADIGQVVNARRGMDAYGTTTSEGANVNRGRYGRTAAERTGQLDRRQRLQNSRYPVPDMFELADVKRLTVRTIYDRQLGREETVALLARYGYLT